MALIQRESGSWERHGRRSNRQCATTPTGEWQTGASRWREGIQCCQCIRCARTAYSCY
ncbi:hypothetical protein BDP55DRAFT_672006 [Colletotrichum godetiae]|uniref:Uncharacterized protein n=1 Tax=Colletotrichum godetiae TaxID=1209918 RepID=A0AAJ0EV32_9PEZI|nr:uncharacterized protein BDP55DRAFT_672006 [Colletotrichum godetiae]KAK1672865.1 hypothetical protein BDP55DRAFT_672006 [Colletotrichum godetiae]